MPAVGCRARQKQWMIEIRSVARMRGEEKEEERERRPHCGGRKEEVF